MKNNSQGGAGLAILIHIRSKYMCASVARKRLSNIIVIIENIKKHLSEHTMYYNDLKTPWSEHN